VRPRLLDLFCGAGGAAMGYHRAGFDVVGVDLHPQPLFPFAFIQADAIEVLATTHGWDAIHASPPCQLWADGTPDRTKHVDLISPARPLLRAAGVPYVIENVRVAPLQDRVMICGGGLALTHGDYQLHRHRYFESNVPLMGVPCTRQRKLTMSVVGHGTPSGMRRSDRPDPTVADRRLIMGIDWMIGDRHALAESIPPAYTEFLGGQLLQHLRAAACA
jgi:DNA (cytosine-5)-methyltransferase 1